MIYRSPAFFVGDDLILQLICYLGKGKASVFADLMIKLAI